MYKKLLILIVILVLWVSSAFSYGIHQLPHYWANASDFAYKSNAVVYCINTLIYNTALSNSTRNGWSVRQGGIYSALEEWRTSGLPGIILFEVSGNISWVLDTVYYLGGSSAPGNDAGLIIAGQTAPGKGVSINDTVWHDYESSNVMLWHIRLRPGDGVSGVTDQLHKAYLASADNEIVANCSTSWGLDINLGSGSSTGITFYRTISSEALDASTIEHSKGMSSSQGGENAAIIECLMVCNSDRNPYIQSGHKLIANNVSYGYYLRPIMAEWNNAPIYANVMNNVVIGAPFSVWQYFMWFGSASYPSPYYGINSGSQFYINGNRLIFNSNTYDQSGPSDLTYVHKYSGQTILNVTSEISSCTPTGYVPMATSLVYDTVLDNAGAFPNNRDAVDTRVVNLVKNNQGAIIDSQSEVGGWLAIPEEGWRSVADIGFPASPFADSGDGRMNIQVWLDYLADSKLPGQAGPETSTEITNISTSTSKTPPAYKQYAQPGNAVYSDRVYTFISVLSKYQAFDGIQTPCDDKNESASSVWLTFDLASQSYVYVALDDRVSAPSWLTTNYTDTTDNITVQFTGYTVSYDVYKSNSTVSAGTTTLNGTGLGVGISGSAIFVMVEPSSSPGATYITSITCPASTYNADDSFECTIGWNQTPDGFVDSGGSPSLSYETGANDLLCDLSDATHCTTRTIIDGMRTTDLNLKAGGILSIPSGSSITYSSVAVDQNTLPSSITNTTVIEAPETEIAIPGAHPSIASYIAEQGYLLPDDSFELGSDITEAIILSYSGTSGHPIRIDFNGFEWSGAVEVSGDYWLIQSTTGCGRFADGMTLSGDNNSVNIVNGVTDTGSGNTIIPCLTNPAERVNRIYNSGGHSGKYNSNGINLKQ